MKLMTEPLAHEQPTLAATVNAVAHSIEKVLSPGDVAALRRLRPEDASCAAFWRVVVTLLAPALPNGGPAREDGERRWAVILQAMAEMQGLHAPGARMGRALAAAGLAELRVLKLLRASGDTLFDAVRVTAHYLASTATMGDHVEIARLVLSDGRDDEERVRRQIARDFYTQQERNEKEASK
jgi:CRISPR type I-E-associated protein CasB/Cse2